jgi:hypothetical protein
MNIHVILIAYALDVTPLVYRVTDFGVTWHIFTHSKNPEVLDACHYLLTRADFPLAKGIFLYDYQQNRGLGKSANDGIIEALYDNAEVIIIPNDDVLMERADFDKLVQETALHPECGLVFCNGYDRKHEQVEDLKFGVFGINRIALETVGYFDQNLPDYFCDCDYLYRCALARIQIHHVDTSIVHLGSATLDAVPALREQLQRTFPADNAYFRRKWGGEPYHETFSHPFNDPTLSYVIPAENRDNPYPAHRRPEQELDRQ